MISALPTVSLEDRYEITYEEGEEGQGGEEIQREREGKGMIQEDHNKIMKSHNKGIYHLMFSIARMPLGSQKAHQLRSHNQ